MRDGADEASGNEIGFERTDPERDNDAAQLLEALDRALRARTMGVDTRIVASGTAAYVVTKR